MDYVLNDDGCAVAPEGYTDLNSVKYTANMNYYYGGNKWLTYPVVGGTIGEELNTLMEKNYAGDVSPYYDFIKKYPGEFLKLPGVFLNY